MCGEQCTTGDSTRAPRWIIPACAGNSLPRPPSRTACRDHPRVCGEQRWDANLPGKAVGSSPRVRGTVRAVVDLLVVTGIIPACAGNRSQELEPSRDAGDHPRVCGEQVKLRSKALGHLGSSPRVRGTARISSETCKRRGIIPACAGNSMPRCRVRRRGRGSSPRVRGTVTGA